MKKPRLLKLVELGNPILRRKGKLVKNPLDPKIRELASNMILTAKKSQGVGIAAPQVGQSLRLFIVASVPTPAYPKAPRMAPTVIMNPRILKKSRKTVSDWEGCLSIPGLYGLVSRHDSVDVEYTNHKAEIVQRTFKDLASRVFQHEFDHINGVLFIDRTKLKNLVMKGELMRILGELKEKGKRAGKK